MMERRLGRGLGSLLGHPDEVEDQTSPTEVAVDRIRPNPKQPRKHFDDTALSQLAESLRSHGMLQPVVVREARSGFELIAGERRWRAARLAGLSKIPAVIRAGVSDHEMLELALIENVQRQDLDPIERARGFRNMADSLGITQEEVALKVGMQRTSVTNHLRLLDLPQVVQDAISKGLLTLGHAKGILAIASEDGRIALMERAVREGLSVRQVELAARSGTERALRPDLPATGVRPAQAWIGDIEARIRESIGTKVSIQNRRGYKGRIVIEYFDRAALERICELLAPERELQ